MNERVKIVVADITKQSVDAIVNAANRWMLGGGGVDGAIHRAAGPKLKAACAAYPADAKGYRVQTGDAKITEGYNLPAKHVIHTAGPDCRAPEFAGVPAAQDAALASAYRRSLEVAKENGCKTIAFPSISTGIFGFPVERAAKIAADVIEDFLSREPDMSVSICVWNPGSSLDQEQTRVAYEKAFAAQSTPHRHQCKRATKGMKTISGEGTFPETLTAEMLAGFKQTANGATCPHHGFIGGVHYIAKCTKYAELNPHGHPSDGHVHNEYLADCFLRAAGLNVPESREYQVDFHDGHGPRIVRLARFIENAVPLDVAFAQMGSPGAIIDQVLLAFPILSFAAAIDTFHNDNALVDADGRIWYVDNGADFDFRALGGRKGWWFDRLDPNDSATGYLALRNHPGAHQLQNILRMPDKTIWGVASSFDFEKLANLLPDELRTEAVMNYARALRILSMTA